MVSPFRLPTHPRPTVNLQLCRRFRLSAHLTLQLLNQQGGCAFFPVWGSETEAPDRGMGGLVIGSAADSGCGYQDVARASGPALSGDWQYVFPRGRRACLFLTIRGRCSDFRHSTPPRCVEPSLDPGALSTTQMRVPGGSFRALLKIFTQQKVSCGLYRDHDRSAPNRSVTAIGDE